MKVAAGALLVLVLTSASAAWGEAEIGGFVQANAAARIVDTDKECSEGDCDYMLVEERAELKFSAFSNDGAATFGAKIDFYHDAIKNEPGIEFREGAAGYSLRHFSSKVGRQVVTWGVGDMLFINDVFPKDWAALFTGRPLEYLKVGSDAARLDFFLSPADLEIIGVPFFQPDRLPGPDRFLLPESPFPAGLPQREDRPENSLDAGEAHGRLGLTIGDWKFFTYASRMHFRTPSMRLNNPAAPSEVVLFYPRLNIYGASLTGGFLGGVLALEAGYLDSEKDRDGEDPAIENSMWKGIIGYSRQLWADATLGIQGYSEDMLFHDNYKETLPQEMESDDKVRSVATLRFTQFLFHQTLTLNAFGFWGISDEDAYLIPSARYALADPLWLEIGANIFVGRDDDTMFGSMEDNDNAYVTVRYAF